MKISRTIERQASSFCGLQALLSNERNEDNGVTTIQLKYNLVRKLTEDSFKKSGLLFHSDGHLQTFREKWPNVIYRLCVYMWVIDE